MIDLLTLVGRLSAQGLLVDQVGDVNKVYIDHLANDSRKVGPAGLFIAIKGELVDGHLFIEKAVQNGAIAIVCEAMPAEVHLRFPGVVFVQVSQARTALAELAAAFYRDPARHLRMVGITGTNGKTTTAFLVHHLLEGLGLKAGLISTVEYRIGAQVEEATHTTPDVLDTCRLLRKMVDAGCKACVMEVSSHALMQDRVRTIPYEVAVFSNLTQDHLDYHGTMDAYLEAKKKLFDNLDEKAKAIYNIDDAAGKRMVAGTAATGISYSCLKPADLQATILENAIEGLLLEIDGKPRRFKLVGHFNAYNLLAAYGVGIALGFAKEEVLAVLMQAMPVPGRFEMLLVSKNRHVIVDYAHTPDALENVLQTICSMKPETASLWCMFGCGGDRDAKKRPMMGRIAEHFADFVVATSDNPRTEDPEAILNDIRAGISEPDKVRWIVSRKAAIQEIADHASAGDVILLAGKGHETYQVVGTEKIDFDDRLEAKAAFGA
ncbi:MAG: UDP-N-acetylmuramoyl-L-alanyl-D-glutamate--2,6-diaminopimelate ligase [Bacteroidota bacterium]